MKKIIRNFIILFSLLLSTAVVIPWNNTEQWGINIPFLQEQEMYIKGGIGGLLLIISIVYLFIANSNYKENKKASKSAATVSFLTIYMYLVAVISYTSLIFYNVVYSTNPNPLTLMKVGFFVVMTLLLVLYGHILVDNYKKQCNGRRTAYFLLILSLTGISAYFAFWMKQWGVTEIQYENMNTSLLYYVPIGTVGLYLIHILILSFLKGKSKNLEKVEMDDYSYDDSKIVKNKTDNLTEGGTIVSPEQAIVSTNKDLDPTNIIYEDVNVDPEFSSSKNSNSVNSIEYYIEKPKMFKVIDPTFDQLVEYIRAMPQVVTKLEDDKITFYVDRKPFIVLMNFGNYYRLAFKYDLEKGIRLIIKYPTISKNKSTKNELWFKANNYGDIPKDVIFQIVKTSYDSINL